MKAFLGHLSDQGDILWLIIYLSNVLTIMCVVCKLLQIKASVFFFRNYINANFDKLWNKVTLGKQFWILKVPRLPKYGQWVHRSTETLKHNSVSYQTNSCLQDCIEQWVLYQYFLNSYPTARGLAENVDAEGGYRISENVTFVHLIYIINNYIKYACSINLTLENILL